MPARNDCPSDDQLARLQSGLLTDDELNQLDPHISQCGDCATRIESLVSADTMMQDLAPSPALGRVGAAGQVLDRLVDRLNALPGLASAGMPAGDAPSTSAGLHDTKEGHQASPSDDSDLTFLAPPEQADELGRLGGYRVLRLLGAGGMGLVFEAEDPDLKRRVALKVIRPHLATRPGAAERFRREAQAAAAVRHEHVVTIFQVGQDRGTFFIAQELLSGETLDDRLQRDKTLSSAESVAIARQIAAGLAAAHARELMHRDIKPANIWLEAHEGDTPRVKILDFGLARSWEGEAAPLTESGLIVGTPAYMAPEQAGGKTLDARADLFSLGAVLYRMLTGISPFARGNTLETLHALAVETPQSPAELQPAVAPELSALVLQLLQKNPADRPATARRVSELLAQVPTVPASERARPAPKPRLDDDADPPRNPWLIALAFGGLAAALVVGVIIIIKNQKGEEIARIAVPEGGSATIEPEGKHSTKPADSHATTPPKPPVLPAAGSMPPVPSPATTTSPLDLLDPAQIPEIDRYPWQPQELVAMIGSHRWRGKSQVSVRPDGKVFASFQDGCQLVDVETGRRLMSIPLTQSHDIAAPFSSDGQRLALANGIWDVSGQEPKQIIEQHIGSSVRWFAQDKRLFTRLRMQEAGQMWFVGKLWNVAGDEPQLLAELPDIFHAAMTEDGGTCAVSRKDNYLVEIYAVTADRFQKRLTLPQPQGTVSNLENSLLAFLPDGRLCTLHDRKTLCLWNITGDEAKLLASFTSEHAWEGLAVSPLGNKACIFNQGGFQIYDVRDAALLPLDIAQSNGSVSGNLRVAQFLPDGKSLVTSHFNGELRVWGISGDPIAQRHPLPPQPHAFGTPPRITPDGRSLITFREDHRTALWRLNGDGPREASATVPGVPISIAPGGKQALTWDFGPNLGLERIADQQLQHVQDLRPPAAIDGSVATAFHPAHEQQLAIGLQSGRISWVQLKEGAVQELSVATAEGGCNEMAFANGGRTLVTRHKDFGLVVWDLSPKGLEKIAALPLENAYMGPIVSSDGMMIAAGDMRGLHLWTLREGRPTKPDLFAAGAGPCAAFDPRGDRVATATWGLSESCGVVILWDVATGKRLREIAVHNPVTNLLFAPDGRHLITRNEDGTLYILRL